MAQPASARPVFVARDITLARILLFVATILFVIAALIAGGVIQGLYWPWAFGALSAWALAGAV